MVKETEYYDVLEVSTTATSAEIKRACRKMAVKTHPDKNPDDKHAQEKFQQVSEAYQVLSDEKLRKQYDEFGKEHAKPVEGFDDPVAMASNIFGGGAFESYIGEISIIKEMTQLGDLEMEDGEHEHAEEDGKSEPNSTTGGASAGAAKGGASSTSKSPAEASKTSSAKLLESGHESPKPQSLKTEHDALKFGHGRSKSNSGELTAAQAEKEAKLAAKQKRKAEIERIDKENQEVRQKRIDDLTQKLIERLGVLTESPNPESDMFRSNFQVKMEEEARNLKMESFGEQILHAIGHTYYTRGSLFLKSQKFLGFGGMFGKMKEAGNMVKEVFDGVSVAMEAQNFMQAASEMEHNVTPEKQAELEQIMLGKMLGALWVGSKFEIQGILRAVCDNVLNDKKVPLVKRKHRAEALKIMGKVFKNTVRTKEEQEEMQFFESLVAEANAKNSKKLRKDFAAGAATAAAAAQAEKAHDAHEEPLP